MKKLLNISILLLLATLLAFGDGGIPLRRNSFDIEKCLAQKHVKARSESLTPR